MYPKLQGLLCLFGVFVLGFATVAVRAQSGAPNQPPRASVRGHVSDPTGARIPGAEITITNAMGVPVKTTTSNATGDYSVTGLAPGSYIVEATMREFSLFTSPTFQLEAGQSRRVDISMALAVAQQQVQVSSEGGPTVSTQAGANTNAIVLKGNDLKGLSDDPDELSNELQALAGPAAGPNGGQIYIDGFTGGQLPPKSAIREIIINQNPFSAQYGHLGYGRIEILTKPGSDTFHGRVFAMGNDNAFNTGNPFTSNLPSYHSYMMNGTVSGPLSKWASYFFSVQERSFQNDSVYSIPGGPVFDAATNTYSPSSSPLSGSVFSPSRYTGISPRVDLQLGQNNTLTLRYRYFRMNRSNTLGGSTSLPTLATSADSTENTFQIDDTQIVSDHLVNETRAEYRVGISSGQPVSTEPTINVQGVFNGGGSSSQYSNNRSTHLELQNFTTLSVGSHDIKFGTWMRDNLESNSSNSGYNGSFTFPSITAFIDTWNGVAQGLSFQQIAAACPPDQKGGCLPIKLSYTTGPTSFKANIYDVALFYQDDWTVNRFLTLSGGLRWESQNHIPDHSDWAPRFAFAYALDGHQKGATPKTVLRGGFGFFYSRFGVGDLMDLERFNGKAHSQTHTVIENPTCFSGTSLSSIQGGLASCGVGTQSEPQIDTLYHHYRSPYTEMLSFSLERQVTKTMTLTFTYLHSYGLHQMATINANAFLPGTYQYGSDTLTGVRPNPSLGIVDEFFPEAVYKENQIIVNINARVSRNFSVMGFYNASWANADTGTAENSYNLMDSYGRASFVRPQWLFLMGNYNGPGGVSFYPFIVAQAGGPYNLTTPFDLTGDNFFNDRPSYASPSSNPADVVDTSFGALDTVPQPGETLVPYNAGTSPSAIAVNLRVSRSFGIGPKIEGPGGPHPGGGGFHGHGRFRGFGGPYGGRGGMRAAAGTGRKYSLTFSAQALNLFNDINYGTPVATVTAQNFGQSTSLAGGMFSSGSASRRIFFQTAFQF